MALGEKLLSAVKSCCFSHFKFKVVGKFSKSCHVGHFHCQISSGVGSQVAFDVAVLRRLPFLPRTTETNLASHHVARKHLR